MPQETSARSHVLNDLIIKIQANDPVTLQSLYVENYRKVEQYITNNSGSADDAKDIFQEAFTAAWRSIQLGRFEMRNDTAVSGYIFQIAKNKWLDQLRSARIKQTVSLSDMETPEMATAALPKEELDYLEKVRTHFDALGDQCKELLKRFYFNKESMKTIAAFFSWTEASAKNNKYRCLERLRNRVINKS